MLTFKSSEDNFAATRKYHTMSGSSQEDIKKQKSNIN